MVGTVTLAVVESPLIPNRVRSRSFLTVNVLPATETVGIVEWRRERATFEVCTPEARHSPTGM